ncbi:hypothetical protein N9Z41_02085 [bacterium]|nr:hypothetical protein [bacterium]
MEIHNKIAKDLSSILGKKFDKLTIANEQALSTIDPGTGRIFTLEYTGSGKTYGSVTVNIVDPSTLVVYYNNNISEDMKYDDKKSWYGFLKELRYFAKRNLMGFDVRNIGKQQLDKKDYAYIKTNDVAVSSDEFTMESKMHGSLRTSYQNIGEVRVVVKHSKPVDEEKRGSRTRQIHSLYVEDTSKQRTRMPYNYLAGARALAQHVNQGGVFEDEFGQHILDMVQEVVDLKKFVKSFRRADNFANEDAYKIIEQARERAIGLNSTLKTLSGPKGYAGYVGQYEPTEESIEQADLDEIRTKLVRIQKDNIVDTVLPSLARGIKAMNIEENMELAQVAGDANSEIEIYPNPEEDQDIKNYIGFVKRMKASNRKTSEDPMDGIASRIVLTLTKRATDDDLARQLGGLDMTDSNQKRIAYQLAGKYLKGKVKVVEPKAKKHIKKTEEVQFEDWANNIVEGTWAIPDTAEAVADIEELMKQPLPLGPGGEDATNAVGGAIGDDGLFDDLGDAGDEDPNADARPIIADWIIQNIRSYPGMPADLASKLIAVAKTGGAEANPQMELPFEEVDIEEGSIKYMHSLKAKGKSIEDIAKELDMDPAEVEKAMAKTEDIAVEESQDEAEEINNELDRILNLAGLSNEDFDSSHQDHSNHVANQTDKNEVMDILKKYPSAAKKMAQAGDVFSIYGSELYKEIEEYMNAESGIYMAGSDVDPIEEINGMLDNLGLLDLPNSVFESEEVAEMMQCKDCGDEMHKPTTGCENDCHDEEGDHWIKVDVDGDGDDDIALAKDDPEELRQRMMHLAGLL